MNSDYIPLDQKVITENVEALEKRRKFKAVNRNGHLTESAKEAFAEAYIAGSDGAFIVFPNAYENARKYRRITVILESIGVDCNFLNEDIFTSRNWVYEAIADRSERALSEVKNIIRD